MQQYARGALEAYQFKLRMHVTRNDQQPASGPAPSTSSAPSVAETSADQPSVLLSKRAKLFNFISVSAAQTQTVKKEPSVDDIKQQVAVFTSTPVVCAEQKLETFLDERYNSLLPLAKMIFTAPVSSAASERVFSRAGIIMRPMRSRLSKMNLSKLVFLSCNQSLAA